LDRLSKGLQRDILATGESRLSPVGIDADDLKRFVGPIAAEVFDSDAVHLQMDGGLELPAVPDRDKISPDLDHDLSITIDTHYYVSNSLG
jgi:hypothetical protein